MTCVKTGLFWLDKADVSVQDIRDAYTYPHPNEPTETFSTFIELEDRIGIPHGDLKKASRFTKDIVDKTIMPVSGDYNLTGLTLRDYQEDALKEAIEYLNDGTSFNLAGSPGSGKSIMLSALLTKLKTKTLIIAHLSMLTEQLRAEIEQFTDIKVSVLNANNLELSDVNIATSQFISKRPELWKKIKHNIGLIVVDEGETIGSETTLRILQRAHARYRIAISATFTRSVDGRTPALKDMIGDKVITLENSALIKPTIITVKCDEYFQAPMNKNLYKRSLISFFRKNKSIDDKILEIVKGSLKKARQVLIACDLTEFQERYASGLNDLNIKAVVVNGTTPKDKRQEILRDFDAGNIEVLLGFGVLNAGLSMPKISTIIRVSTPGNTEKLEQLIGRARRDYDGKDGAFIIDLMFSGFSANAKRSAMYRRKVKEEDWVLSQVTWEKLKEKLDE